MSPQIGYSQVSWVVGGNCVFSYYYYYSKIITPQILFGKYLL